MTLSRGNTMSYEDVIRTIIAGGVIIIVLLLLALVAIGVTILNRFDDYKEIKDVENDEEGDVMAVVRPVRDDGEDSN
jgi:hypothetical protein